MTKSRSRAGGYQAEYGRPLGGIVNVITKSGGNEIHGDAFAYPSAKSIDNLGDVFRFSSGPSWDYGADLGGSPHDVVQPDVLFVLRDRRTILTEKFVAGAPDLVVEVFSPSTESRDRIAKAKRYAIFGVREMWLVDPVAKTIEILINRGEGFRRQDFAGEDGTVRSMVLAGLDVPCKPIFRPI